MVSSTTSMKPPLGRFSGIKSALKLSRNANGRSSILGTPAVRGRVEELESSHGGVPALHGAGRAGDSSPISRRYSFVASFAALTRSSATPSAAHSCIGLTGGRGFGSRGAAGCMARRPSFHESN